MSFVDILTLQKGKVVNHGFQEIMQGSSLNALKIFIHHDGSPRCARDDGTSCHRHGEEGSDETSSQHRRCEERSDEAIQDHGSPRFACDDGTSRHRRCEEGSGEASSQLRHGEPKVTPSRNERGKLTIKGSTMKGETIIIEKDFDMQAQELKSEDHTTTSSKGLTIPGFTQAMRDPCFDLLKNLKTCDFEANMWKDHVSPPLG